MINTIAGDEGRQTNMTGRAIDLEVNEKIDDMAVNQPRDF